MDKEHPAVDLKSKETVSFCTILVGCIKSSAHCTGMRLIPQGPRRINSKSLQDTKIQGAGDSPRDLVGWALGRDGNNSFLNPDTWDIQVLSWSFMSLCTLHSPYILELTLS